MESLWYVTRLEQENFMTNAAASSETNAANYNNNNNSMAQPPLDTTTMGTCLAPYSESSPTTTVKRSLSQANHSSSTGTVVTPPAKKQRTTLKDTTRAFVRMNANKDALIDVKKTAKALDTPVRRLYDVANILEGAGVLERAVGTSKTIWKWTSAASPYVSDGESDHELSQELLQLQQEEERLDQWLEYYQGIHASWQSLCCLTVGDLEACRDSTQTRLIVPSNAPTLWSQKKYNDEYLLGISASWLQDTSKCLLVQRQDEPCIQRIPLYTGTVVHGSSKDTTSTTTPMTTTTTRGSLSATITLPPSSHAATLSTVTDDDSSPTNSARSTPTLHSFNALYQAVPPPMLDTKGEYTIPPTIVEATTKTNEDSMERSSCTESLLLPPFEALVEAAASRCHE